MVVFVDIGEMPNVNGGPINLIECIELSVNITISRFVSMALTNSEPDPIRKSPAVLVDLGVQSVGDS